MAFPKAIRILAVLLVFAASEVASFGQLVTGAVPISLTKPVRLALDKWGRKIDDPAITNKVIRVDTRGSITIVTMKRRAEGPLTYVLVADETVLAQGTDGRTFTFVEFEPNADPVTREIIQKAIIRWSKEEIGTDLRAETKILQLGQKRARVYLQVPDAMIVDVDLTRTNVIRQAFAEEKLPPLE